MQAAKQLRAPVSRSTRYARAPESNRELSRYSEVRNEDICAPARCAEEGCVWYIMLRQGGAQKRSTAARYNATVSARCARARTSAAQGVSVVTAVKNQRQQERC